MALSKEFLFCKEHIMKDSLFQLLLSNTYLYVASVYIEDTNSRKHKQPHRKKFLRLICISENVFYSFFTHVNLTKETTNCRKQTDNASWLLGLHFLSKTNTLIFYLNLHFYKANYISILLLLV
jgi:hypothetical protein